MSKNVLVNLRLKILSKLIFSDFIVINHDKSIEVVREYNKKKSFELVQQQVGGSAELISNKLFGDYYVFANEDGQLKDLPYNDIATTLFNKYLTGNIVIVKRNLFE